MLLGLNGHFQNKQKINKQTNKKYGCITNSKARKEKEGGKQNVCVCGFAMEGGSRPKAS